ncbi:MAG: autotransporter outer membrane beta-barrel domain-containing protein [Gammaproteobacteria bacterium]|nr:autotransporter outer membrane beta-barrel domain-containing protein [Gammaproteobacteria bacterium]
MEFQRHSHTRSQLPFAYSLFLLLGLCTVFAAPARAQQSLDDAVNAQLEFVSFECEVLLNGDPTNVNALTGELAQICQRGQPSGGSGSSGASGGGAGTATNMPDAVRTRLDGDSSSSEDVQRGFFMTLYSGVSDRRVTDLQDGYGSDIAGAVAGFDREFNEWLGGFAIDYFEHNGDFIGGGNFETQSLGLIVFGSRALGQKGNFDFYAGYNDHGKDRTRVASFAHVEPDGSPFFEANGVPISDFNASQTLAGVQFTYGMTFDNVTFGPRFGLDWSDTQFYTHTETEAVDSGLALTFYGDDQTSLISTIGIDGSVAISTGFGVVLVSEYFNWKHEFDDKQRDVEVSFAGDTRNQRFNYQTDAADEDYFTYGISLTFIFGNDFDAFVAYERTSSHDFLSAHMFNLGFRKGF